MKRKTSFLNGLVRVTLVGALVYAWTPTAQAVQDSPFSLFLAGSYPISVGTTHHYTNGEYGIVGGFAYQEPTWPVGLQFEGMTYRFGFNDTANMLANADGYMQMTAGTANVTWMPEKFKQRRVKPRLISGIGVYNRVIRTTEERIYGGTCFDPWWGYYPCAGTGTVITDSQSQTKFGWNIGGSLGWEMLSGSEFFIDVRYHQAETSHKATAFVPLNFGFRW